MGTRPAVGGGGIEDETAMSDVAESRSNDERVRSKRMRHASNALFGIASAWAVAFVVLAAFSVSPPLGLGGGICGSLVIGAIVLRGRADPAFGPCLPQEDVELPDE